MKLEIYRCRVMMVKQAAQVTCERTPESGAWQLT
jgi:hypothetical protein